jgi:GNAT superfamily N-acetyltransferase
MLTPASYFLLGLQRIILSLQSYFWTDRSASPSTVESYYNQASAIHAMPEGSRYLEFKTLAVDPAYQRKGYGEKLVEWCGMRAIEDGIPVFGDASANGLPLYVRNGCKEIGRIVLPEQIVERPNGFEGEPLKFERMEVVVLRWDSESF